MYLPEEKRAEIRKCSIENRQSHSEELQVVEHYGERRRYQRSGYNSPMSLYRMDHQEQCYYAEMKDFSQGGLPEK